MRGCAPRPVGGAVAHRGHIGADGDTARGGFAARTGLPFGAVDDRAGPLLDAVAGRVPFGVGRKDPRAQVRRPLLDGEESWRG